MVSSRVCFPVLKDRPPFRFRVAAVASCPFAALRLRGARVSKCALLFHHQLSRSKGAPDALIACAAGLQKQRKRERMWPSVHVPPHSCHPSEHHIMHGRHNHDKSLQTATLNIIDDQFAFPFRARERNAFLENRMAQPKACVAVSPRFLLSTTPPSPSQFFSSASARRQSLLNYALQARRSLMGLYGAL
jgi:hypothetical protein